MEPLEEVKNTFTKGEAYEMYLKIPLNLPDHSPTPSTPLLPLYLFLRKIYVVRFSSPKVQYTDVRRVSFRFVKRKSRSEPPSPSSLSHPLSLSPTLPPPLSFSPTPLRLPLSLFFSFFLLYSLPMSLSSPLHSHLPPSLPLLSSPSRFPFLLFLLRRGRVRGWGCVSPWKTH